MWLSLVSKKHTLYTYTNGHTFTYKHKYTDTAHMFSAYSYMHVSAQTLIHTYNSALDQSKLNNRKYKNRYKLINGDDMLLNLMSKIEWLYLWKRKQLIQMYLDSEFKNWKYKLKIYIVMQ